MIAKAATISHGSNAIRYSVNKDRADIVKTNLLPDDISPEAMFKRMMLVQKMFANERKRGRPLLASYLCGLNTQKKARAGRWTTGHVWQTSSSKSLIP